MNTTDKVVEEAIYGVDDAAAPQAGEGGLVPFEARAEEMLNRVYRGIYHIHKLHKEPGMWWFQHYGDLATFDHDILTRLVLGAHEYCIRVFIKNGGPRCLKVTLHPRKCREGDVYERHPTIEQAITRWGE